jgi:hypothetical protein
MCCGNQNKMDDTKTHDIEKHIPWQYNKIQGQGEKGQKNKS